MTLTSTPKNASLVGVLLAGAALRALLHGLPGFAGTLAARPELVTPTSAFARLREAAFLLSETGSPYSGDVFHQPPLVFAALYPLLALPAGVEDLAARGFFVLLDLVIAAGLARLCRRTQQWEERADTRAWIDQMPLSPLLSPHELPRTVAAVYLFNPYTLGSNVAMSTTSLSHLLMLAGLLLATDGAMLSTALFLALGIYVAVYPVLLVVPMILLLSRATQNGVSAKSIAPRFVLLVVAWLGALLYVSKAITGGWDFLAETYVWVAKYSDLTPNVGIFWYFFMEVFDRFIPYFLLVLHLHPLIYVAPMFFRLRNRPQAYACALIGLGSLFQAYPSMGDFGFVLSLMIIHAKTVMTIKNRFVYALGLGVASCMLPVMWFLWLFPASGNANFFYNQTLVYQIFNCQLINAFVGAGMKRDKDLQLYFKRLEEAKDGHSSSPMVPANEDKKNQ